MVKHTHTIRRQTAEELFECVWPFCGIDAYRNNRDLFRDLLNFHDWDFFAKIAAFSRYKFLQKNKAATEEMFYKKTVLKNFTILTGKHLYWSLFVIKLQAFKPATLWKRDFNIGVFLWICETNSGQILKNIYELMPLKKLDTCLTGFYIQLSLTSMNNGNHNGELNY